MGKDSVLGKAIKLLDQAGKQLGQKLGLGNKCDPPSTGKKFDRPKQEAFPKGKTKEDAKDSTATPEKLPKGAQEEVGKIRTTGEKIGVKANDSYTPAPPKPEEDAEPYRSREKAKEDPPMDLQKPMQTPTNTKGKSSSKGRGFEP